MTIGYQNITIVKEYDPYDVCCVVLLVLYCLGEIELSPNIFTRILQLVPNEEADGVGLPTLENLVNFLRGKKQTEAASKLVEVIFTITSYNHIHVLIQLLRGAIVDSPDQQGIYSKFVKILCRSGVICSLLPRAIVDTGVSEFVVEDIHQIVDSLHAFKSAFEITETYTMYVHEASTESSLKSRIFPHDQTDGGLGGSPFVTHASTRISNPWLIVSAAKFRIILNHTINASLKDIYNVPEIVESITKYTTLNDRTRFPDILLLEMVLLRKSKNYQKTVDKIYQYFDYCRNSNISVSSSSNFSHVCQTFILSSLYQDHGSPDLALKTLQELINTIREKTGVHGLSNLWDILIHHLLVQPEESRILRKSIYDLLRPLNDNKNSTPEMLQYWYTCQVALNLHESGYVPNILEQTTMVNALSHDFLKDDMNRVATEVSTLVWSFVGFDDIAQCFGEPPVINVKKSKHLKRVDQLLKDKYYSEAIDKIEKLVDEANANNDSMSSEFDYLQKRIHIMLAAGNTARAHPIICQYIDKCRETKNDYQLSRAILCMVRLMNGWGQYHDSYNLMNSNLNILLQYPGAIKDEARILYNDTLTALGKNL
ncbi:unnamed protein product [Kluyveromyces dobzhanskii CBS 2104]|uniref:WGS project CCBQ000000000 data, contig 00099 n=1 Tax=Kluyveromyces dobzhanskii CBS 2104 TaxID=1427455 RepID=A0A0A8L4W8_9SACH|nr:unnamed protein product [Kluyveromyces dobzhanskii CBS 2104]